MNLSKLQTEEVLKQFLSKENGLNEVLEIFMNSLMYSERDVFLKSQDSIRVTATGEVRFMDEGANYNCVFPEIAWVSFIRCS